MSSRRHRRLVLVVLAVALAAAGCTSGSDSASPAAPTEVRIGLLAPLSGANKTAGTEAQRGAQLAADVVNGLNSLIPLPLAETSGLTNLGNARIRIVSADTKGDAATGISATGRLVTDQHVAAVIGAYDPEVTLAASQTAERIPVPFVNSDTSLSYLTDRGLDWFFHLGPSVRTSGEAFFSLMKTEQRQESDQPQAKGPNNRVAVLYADDKTGNDVSTVVKELADEGGFVTPKLVSYDPKTTTDLSAQVEEIKQSQADTVFVAPTAETVSLMVQAFSEQQYKPAGVMAYGSGYISDQALRDTGPVTAGLCRETGWSPELATRNVAARAVSTLYRSKFNTDMTEEAADAFTAVLTLAIAINNAASVDVRRIRSALLSLDIAGQDTIMPWTGIRFDETHQNTGAASVIEQFLNRAFRPVFPLDSAGKNKLVWPAATAT
ncbi:MAG: branched-chain amino acid transport system substrate-binding protein [Mycobacteriales bacterium]|jgi:branched-chain amino acid transport system substrate-binding protein